MTYVCVAVVFFFFQAEDGIRYLVRSRGLGDVYKRQEHADGGFGALLFHGHRDFHGQQTKQRGEFDHRVPVSYTHLTLPTSDLV